jgi:hypothetical protein
MARQQYFDSDTCQSFYAPPDLLLHHQQPPSPGQSAPKNRPISCEISCRRNTHPCTVEGRCGWSRDILCKRGGRRWVRGWCLGLRGLWVAVRWSRLGSWLFCCWGLLLRGLHGLGLRSLECGVWGGFGVSCSSCLLKKVRMVLDQYSISMCHRSLVSVAWLQTNNQDESQANDQTPVMAERRVRHKDFRRRTLDIISF